MFFVCSYVENAICFTSGHLAEKLLKHIVMISTEVSQSQESRGKGLEGEGYGCHIVIIYSIW